MPYELKFFSEFAGASGANAPGRMWRVEVERDVDALTGAEPVNLTSGEGGLRLEYRTGSSDELWPPLMPSTATARFIAGHDVLAGVFDGGDTEWRLSAYAGPDYQSLRDGDRASQLEWRGFVLPDFYRDDYYEGEQTVELRAIDGLGLLEELAPPLAFDAEGRPSEGRHRLSRHVLSILAEIHAELPMDSVLEWLPEGIDKNESTDETTLQSTWVRDRAFLSSGEDDEATSELTAIDAKSALEDLASRFGCTLLQSDGRWKLLQRDALAEEGLGAFDPSEREGVAYTSDGVRQDAYPPYNPSSVGFPDVQAAPAPIDLSGVELERSVPRRFRQRLRQAQVTHDYEGAFGSLLVNPGFEEGNGQGVPGWTLTDVGDVWARVIGHDEIDFSPPRSQENRQALAFTGSQGGETGVYKQAEQDVTAALDLSADSSVSIRFSAASAARPAQMALLMWLRSTDGFSLGQSLLRITTDVLRAENGVLPIQPLGGLVGQPVVPAGTTLYIVVRQDNDGPQRYGTITLSEDLKAGDSVARGRISDNIRADDLEAGNEEKNDDYDYSAALLVPHWTAQANASCRIDKALTSQWEEIEVATYWATPEGQRITGDLSIAFGTDLFRPRLRDDIALDDVRVGFLGTDGEPVSQTSYVAAQGEGAEKGQRTLRLGAGPTLTSPRRLFAIEAGTGDDGRFLTRWRRRSEAETTPQRLGALHARALMQAARQPLQKLSVTAFLHSGSKFPRAHDTVLVEGVRYVIDGYDLEVSTGRCRLELTELRRASAGGLVEAVSQNSSGEAGSGSAGGARSVVAQQEAPFSGSVGWSQVTGRPPLVQTFEGRSGAVTLEAADIEGALGFAPAEAADLDDYLPTAGGAMTGPLTLPGDPTEDLHAAPKRWIEQKVTELVGSAPEALDTLSELADALGEDANFAASTAQQIGTLSAAVDTLEGTKANASAVPSVLADLDDTSALADATQGQLAQFDGTGWVPASVDAAAGGYNQDLNTYDDVRFPRVRTPHVELESSTFFGAEDAQLTAGDGEATLTYTVTEEEVSGRVELAGEDLTADGSALYYAGRQVSVPQALGPSDRPAFAGANVYRGAAPDADAAPPSAYPDQLALYSSGSSGTDLGYPLKFSSLLHGGGGGNARAWQMLFGYDNTVRYRVPENGAAAWKPWRRVATESYVESYVNSNTGQNPFDQSLNEGESVRFGVARFYPAVGRVQLYLGNEAEGRRHGLYSSGNTFSVRHRAADDSYLGVSLAAEPHRVRIADDDVGTGLYRAATRNWVTSYVQDIDTGGGGQSYTGGDGISVVGSTVAVDNTVARTSSSSTPEVFNRGVHFEGEVRIKDGEMIYAGQRVQLRAV